METYKYDLNGLSFICRKDTSDQKTIDEVVGRNVYQKRGMKILPGETWLDLGANIGSFSCLARSLGANVIAFEPDPFSFKMLVQNVGVNSVKSPHSMSYYDAGVGLQNERVPFHVSATNQYWRNSMVHFGKGKIIQVKVMALQPFLKKDICVKMDIEGMEMILLEKLDFSKVKKMVFEWSFDIDPDIDRYRAVLKRMQKFFKEVKSDSIKPEHKTWLKSWFPPCKNVFCFNE